MNLRDRPVTVWLFPLVMLTLALLMLGSDAGGMASTLRGALFDFYQDYKPRNYEKSPVRVVEFDQEIIARYGDWPWPHAALAEFTDALKAQGAASVVLVSPIERIDPASPRNLVELIPPGPSFDASRVALLHLPSPDGALAASLTGIEAVCGYRLDNGTPATAPVRKAKVVWDGTGEPFGHTRTYDRAVPLIDPIAAASAGTGAVNLTVDADGKLRRMPLAFRLRLPKSVEAVASLDGEVLRVAEGLDKLTLKSDDGRGGIIYGKPGARAVETAKGEIPTMPDGTFWIAYSGPQAERSLSASAVLGRSLPSGALQGAIVYLGSPGETVSTPLGDMTATEVHAEAAESLLLGHVLRRPTTAAEAEFICLLLFGVVGIFVFVEFGLLPSIVFTVGAIACGLFVSWQFYVGGVLFDAAGLGLGLVLTCLGGAAARRFETVAKRHELKMAFADSLPQNTIRKMSRHPELLRLEGETRIVSYLCCGVRGFAEMAASFGDDPAAFTRLMQRVLEPLIEEAMRHGGKIDKMTGDGFSVYWNAPLSDPEHAMHACDAASGMMDVIAKINETITHERRNDGVALAPVEIGIGISTSPCIAGGIKAHGRTVYSVNGDCVEMATRIRQISGQYGPAVVVGEDTRKAAERGFAFLEIDFIAIGTGGETVKLYAMLGNPVMRASPRFRALATFHDHIFQAMRTRQWHKARELIAQCRKLSGASQRLYELHLARIAYFEENPPEDNWDGAFRPLLK